MVRKSPPLFSQVFFISFTIFFLGLFLYPPSFSLFVINDLKTVIDRLRIETLVLLFSFPNQNGRRVCTSLFIFIFIYIGWYLCERTDCSSGWWASMRSQDFVFRADEAPVFSIRLEQVPRKQYASKNIWKKKSRPHCHWATPIWFCRPRRWIYFPIICFVGRFCAVPRS